MEEIDKRNQAHIHLHPKNVEIMEVNFQTKEGKQNVQPTGKHAISLEKLVILPI